MSQPTKKVMTKLGNFEHEVEVRTSDGRRVLSPCDHAIADLESLIPHEHEYIAALIVDEGVEEFRKMHPEDRLSAWAAAARVIGEIG